MVVSVVQSATSDTVLALSFVVNVHVPWPELPNAAKAVAGIASATSSSIMMRRFI